MDSANERGDIARERQREGEREAERDGGRESERKGIPY